jgi:hypothetical protein
MSLGKSTYADCFKGTLGKRLLTGCLLQSLQQLTGVNFIFCKLLQAPSSYIPFFLTIKTRLRNPVLPKRRFRQRLHHPSHHKLRKRRIHLPRSLDGRTSRPAQSTPARSNRHVRVSVHRRHHRHSSRNYGSGCSARCHRLCVHLHLLLCQ